jgi:hypothetical protein
MTDVSELALVVIMPPAHAMTDGDYRAYLEWTRRYIVCVGEPYSMVLDARRAAPISATQRKILADHMGQTRVFSSEFCAGVAMVYESMVMRSMMTAIFWMTSPPYPTRVCATIEEAKQWCRERLAERAQRSIASRPQASGRTP